MADSVKIRITGDDAPFKRTLGGLGSATASILKGLSGATVAVKAVWAAVGAVGTQYNATIESLTTSFEVMTGSAEKAAGITERLRNIGAKTPFDLKGLASTTKLLMNYGFEANRAVDEMMMLGDIAQGNAEAMNSIAMGYAQMSSLGKVNLQDIKQMINGGFNPLQEISERTGESMEKLYGRISKGTMKVSEITESMKHATSEGGKYYQSMEKQAQTFQGRLDTLKEDATAFAGQLMTSASDGLRDTVIPMATDLLGEFSAAFERGGLDGLIDAATAKIPMLLDVVMSTMKKGFSGLVKWLPGAMKQIATAIPGALRTVVDLSPQIVDAMFEIATSLVADLLTMLPELVPMILEGLGKMLASVGLGLIRMAGGIIDSVVGLFFTTADEAWTALQKGMDRDVLAGMSAKINAKIDVSAAETAITGAYDVLRKALKTDLLTEEQVAEIEKMIGDDYDKVYAKLKSFGLSDEDAKPIAEKVAEAGKTVTAELEKLNLKVKPGTVLKWMRDANGNRVKLRASLKKAGLTPEDIESILKVYEKMGTDLVDGAPNLADEVYKALTDGKPDDKGALKALNDTELGKNLKAVEDWLTEELAKLNTDSADYPAKVSELKEQAAAYKAEAQALHTEMTALIDELAGQPSTVVQAKLKEFAEHEERINALAEKLGLINEQARNAGQRSYELTRAGATTDTGTIAEGVQYAYQNYQLDKQAIEDAAKKAKEEAAEAWRKGLMTAEEHLAKETEIDKQAEQDTAALVESYRQQIAELMQGINKAFAKDNPEEAAVVKSIGEKSVVLDAINTFLDDAAQDKTTPEQRTKIAEMLETAYKELFGQDVTVDPEMMGEHLQGLGNTLNEEITKELQGLEGKENPLLTALEGIFSSGALTDLNIDLSTVEGKMRAAMGDVGQAGADGLADKKEAMTGAAEDNADAAASRADALEAFKKSGGSSADGWIKGFVAKREAMKTEAYNAGVAVNAAFNRGQQAQSPSRLFLRSGLWSGEGYEIGLRKSMGRAIKTARVLAENVAGVVNVPTRIAFAGTSSSVAIPEPIDYDRLADAVAQRPANMYAKGRLMATTLATDNARAIAIRRQRIAAGYGGR